MPLGEPGRVAGVPELDQRLTELLDGVEAAHPGQVLLEGADEALGAAAALRGAERRASSRCPGRRVPLSTTWTLSSREMAGIGVCNRGTGRTGRLGQTAWPWWRGAPRAGLAMVAVPERGVTFFPSPVRGWPARRRCCRGTRPPLEAVIAFIDEPREEYEVEPICRVLPAKPHSGCVGSPHRRITSARRGRPTLPACPCAPKRCGVAGGDQARVRCQLPRLWRAQDVAAAPA